MYVISTQPDRIWALGTAASLQGVADAFITRSERDLEVYVSQDGHCNALDAAEQIELGERARAARLLCREKGSES